MTEPTPPNPNPLLPRGAAAAAPPVEDSALPSSIPGPSPIGALSQYQPTKRLRIFDNETSVTGATIADPTGKKSRLRIEKSSEWATPFHGMKTMADNFLLSFLFYWLGYGPVFTLFLAIFLSAFAGKNGAPGGLPGGMVIFGPYYGVTMDWYLLVNVGGLAVVGTILLAVDGILFINLFFCDSWQDRFKAALLLVGFLAIKALIFSLGSLPF